MQNIVVLVALCDVTSVLIVKRLVMEQIHGHEVLHMMEGNVYSETSLRKAIIDKFGANQLFYTCSASNLTVDGLIEFLKEHDKFKPMNDGFTVDETSVCSNE